MNDLLIQVTCSFRADLYLFHIVHQTCTEMIHFTATIKKCSHTITRKPDSRPGGCLGFLELSMSALPTSFLSPPPRKAGSCLKNLELVVFGYEF